VELTFLSEQRNCASVFADMRERGLSPKPSAEQCRHVDAQITEYFLDGRRHFELELAPAGTEFQRAVWDELCRISYGTTISYLELAQRIGKPTATRAVGGANGKNPIPLVIPCHRVIAASGALGGYSGGAGIKRALLEHEGAVSSQLPLPSLSSSPKIGSCERSSRPPS
jgi:methylated-DNA-[protein]-cysteine S-methyltransferase